MSIKLIRPKTWEVRVYIGSFAGKERYAYSTVEGKKAGDEEGKPCPLVGVLS